MKNLFDISGKKAIVTGGTRGLAMEWQRALWKPDARWLLWAAVTRCIR